MKYYLTLRDDGTILRFSTTKFGESDVEAEIEGVPDILLGADKYVGGEIVKDEKTRESLSGKAAAYDRMIALKGMLADTDYKTMKYIEGKLTEEEYEAAKAERQLWRDEINEIQQEYGFE